MTTIRLGSHDEDVIVLQRLLSLLGFSVVNDCIFGNGTLAAVQTFQSQNSLTADGIVGPNTWNALFFNSFAADDVLEGLDISHHNADEGGPVDFDFIADNYWFCFVKSTEGATVQDPMFLDNFKALRDRHILRGAYYFFRMMNPDIQGQINNFLNAGIDYRQKGILPPVLDVEPSLNEFKNTAALTASKNDIVARMHTWLNAVEAKTGKTPIIYTSRHIWDDILKSPTGFERYPLWVASYSNTATQPAMPLNWKNYIMWQYTENGSVNGKVGFDVNRLNISFPQLLKMAGF